MRSGAVRIEAIRFSLLIVLTIALASVAFRIDSHPSSNASKAHGGSSPLATPGAGTPGAGPSVSPSVQPTHATRSPRSTGGGSGGGGTGGGGTGSPDGVQVLPVTGRDSTLRLGALAFVLIGGGTLTMRVAGPHRRRQGLTVQD